jgi:hypothetical protein
MSLEKAIEGLCDLHIHAGPSISKRAVDSWEVYEEALKNGFRGLVIKDHYFPTMMSSEIVQKHLGDDKLKIFGEIVLNNAQGGINIKAVDAACGMNVKIVCMPTVSSKHHIKKYEGRAFVGGGKESIAEKPICYIDEKGNLSNEVIELIEYLSKKPDVILATGHGSPEEIDALITEAVSKGIKRILVNHPFCLVDASLEQMIKWANMGCMIELNACDIDPVSSFADGDLDLVGEILKNIPAKQIIIDSDYGQNGNIKPVEGLIHFTKFLSEKYGVKEEDIRQMGVINPGWLLGLNEI